MGNCCAKNGELEQFEKNLIHFKGQAYEEIKARLKEDNALFEDDQFRHNDFQSEEKIQELYKTLSEANQESSIITCSTSNNNPDGQKNGSES